MITVTDTAKKQALRLMDDEGKSGFFIRVGVEGGGCSGLMYQLTFDNEKKEIEIITDMIHIIKYGHNIQNGKKDIILR